MKTKAAVYVEFGKPMVIDDIELPEPGPSQVEVKLFASGICHSQLHQLGRPKSPVPMVLGHEASGVVTRIGRDVRSVQEGDHVLMGIVQRNILDPVLPVVARVTYAGKEVTFGGPAYIGMYTWAEHTVVDQQMVVKIDKDVATDVTCIVGCAVLAGRRRRAQLGPGAGGPIGRGLRGRRRRSVGGPGVRQLGCRADQRGRSQRRKTRVRQTIRSDDRHQRQPGRSGGQDPGDHGRHAVERRRLRLRCDRSGQDQRAGAAGARAAGRSGSAKAARRSSWGCRMASPQCLISI